MFNISRFAPRNSEVHQIVLIVDVDFCHLLIKIALWPLNTVYEYYYFAFENCLIIYARYDAVQLC